MIKVKREILSVSIIIVTLAVVNCLTPYISRKLPNDYFRTNIILDSLKNQESFEPSIVILGDSKGMSGIDCNYIENYITDESIYNFCTPSQTLIESALYYSLLPTSVHTVIQCVQIKDFNEKALKFGEAAYAAFAIADYQLSSQGKNLVGDSIKRQFDEPMLIRNFKCRTLLKSGLSYWLLNCLDDDPPTKQMKSLKYPYPYPSDRATTYERDLKWMSKYIPNNSKKFILDYNVESFLHKANDYFKHRNIKYILLITPEHVTTTLDEQYLFDINEEFKEFVILNCLYVLKPEEFYDLLHPNRVGAKVLSHKIVEYLLDNE